MRLQITDNTCAMAQQLIAQGLDGDEVLEFCRGDVVCLRGRAAVFAELGVLKNCQRFAELPGSLPLREVSLPAESVMPVEMKGLTADDHHRPEPADPDYHLDAGWLGRISGGADVELNEQVSQQGAGSASNLASSLASDSLPQEAKALPAHTSRSRIKVIVLIGLIFSVPAVVTMLPHLPFFENWRLPGGGLPETLTSGGPIIRNEPGGPKLMVEPSVAVTGAPAQMRLTLRGATDAIVIVSGLKPGMELSTGRAVGGNTWELSPSDLPNAWIAPPEGYVGSVELIAELRLTEARIADRQIVRVEWKRSGTETEQQHGPDQISTQKKIDPVPAPATIAPAPTKPAPGQLGRTEDKKAQAHWKPKLRPSSTRDGASRAADTKRAIKGFWDWSR